MDNVLVISLLIYGFGLFVGGLYFLVSSSGGISWKLIEAKTWARGTFLWPIVVPVVVVWGILELLWWVVTPPYLKDK